ncbi:MAG: response regulator, partial [Gemmatimonadetes bacterium]|nr:response regulator [Gemmatimonadota bacterium]NIQ52170.1 response regulator [Gemmatimonadota bacterium]NIU72273.1 response regulator [Gammaproteobacteria bacterium]NIX42778.1 response regulator [Gemmatimonadota bacterium]NIY06944.1 response regulator [Gemmatimonadota bacterium]
EGVDAARAGGPAVVLLERTLPDMPGAEALAQLRAEASSASAPVLVVTAEKAPEETERLLAEGAHACFNLPYEVVGFRDTVDALLRL